MAVKAWYKDWFSSPFYHKLYFEKDDKEAYQFLSRLLEYLTPSHQSQLLELNCGRGKWTRFLNEQGFDVTGIDLSFENIEQARQSENERLHFYQHDMRLPAWINYFDYVLNLFTSFGYYPTRREHDDAVNTMVKSLKSSGTIVFDYLNVHYVEEHLVLNEWKRIDKTDFEIHRWMDSGFFYKKITISDPGLSEPVQFTEKLAKLSLGDFTDMLSYQNIQVSEVFGDYSLGRYDVANTPRMIVIGKKK